MLCTVPARLVLLLATLAACAGDRPIHPLRLEGFGSAPIEKNLFPLRGGMRWVFRDELSAPKKTLELALENERGRFFLSGRREGRAEVREKDGFLEIVFRGELVEKPLELAGRAGDTWRAAGAAYTVFGYDLVEAAGREVRALVVAAQRGEIRDLFWFAPGMGWVRLRTERQGRATRDARLISFEPGSAN